MPTTATSIPLTKLPYWKDTASVPDLRKEASRMGIKHIIRNGLEVRTATARKPELIAAIENKLAEINTAQAEANIKRAIKCPEVTSKLPEPKSEVKQPEVAPVKVIEAIEEIEDTEPVTEVSDSESSVTSSRLDVDEEIDSQKEAINKQVEFLVSGLKKYASKLQMERKSFDPSLMELNGRAIAMIQSEVENRSRTSEISSGTLCKWRSEVFTAVEARIKPMAASLPEIIDAYELIRSGVYTAFEKFAKKKGERQSESLTERTKTAVTVNVEKLLDKAVKVVRECVTYKNPAVWDTVVVALCIITGRRQGEILSSAIFTETDQPGWLRFEGQLKRHDSEAVEGFDIPILGGLSAEVLKAMAWLELMGKRTMPTSRTQKALQEAAEKAHGKSRYINEEAKDNWYKLIDTIEGDWLNNGKDRRTPHLFRQIYMQLISEHMRENKKTAAVIAEIAGHSKKSSLAYRSYDCDVIIPGDYKKFLTSL